MSPNKIDHRLEDGSHEPEITIIPDQGNSTTVVPNAIPGLQEKKPDEPEIPTKKDEVIPIIGSVEEIIRKNRKKHKWGPGKGIA